MKQKTGLSAFSFAAIITLLSFNACNNNNPFDDTLCEDELFGCETYDVDATGIPRFVNADYIELDKIGAISKFRSGVGHDYSDDFETCRSMKHYFTTAPSLMNDTTTQIYSPVNGTIIFLQPEWTGNHIQVKCTEYPAFFFDLFHVKLAAPLSVGDVVTAGQLLGTQSSEATMSDIAVAVHTPHDGPNSAYPPGWKLVSWFDVINDSIFQKYEARGIVSRDSCKITKSERDGDILDCQQGWNVDPGAGNVPNWIFLN